MAKAILAFVWATEGITRPVRSFFEYLVFDFSPLAELFSIKDQYLAIPPDGRVRRWIGEGGPIVMMPAFWDPIFQQAKAANPLFKSDEGDTASE